MASIVQKCATPKPRNKRRSWLAMGLLAGCCSVTDSAAATIVSSRDTNRFEQEEKNVTNKQHVEAVTAAESSSSMIQLSAARKRGRKIQIARIRDLADTFDYEEQDYEELLDESFQLVWRQMDMSMTPVRLNQKK